jgi:hypothetical protein
MNARNAVLSSQRGAAFVTTLVFTALLFAIATSIISWTVTERRAAVRHDLRLQARNAVESLLEYGAAQAAAQLNAVTDVPRGTMLNPSLSAYRPSTPPAAFFSGTPIDVSTVEIVGKITSTASTSHYVDPADVGNNGASLLGQRGKTNTITILARARANLGNGVTSDIYLSKTLAVMDRPIFDSAVFYNMDLEIAPGPQMDIYGPVHANGDMYLSKQSSNGNTLNFREKVTTTGKLYKDMKVRVWRSELQSDGTRREIPGNDPIQFLTSGGSTLQNLFGAYGSGNVWRDYKMGTSTDQESAFRSFVSSTYGTNLQTAANNVQKRTLPGSLDQYTPDPTPTDSSDDADNTPRALVERPLATTDAGYKNNAVEMQKMSSKSGIYVMANAGNTVQKAKAPDGTIVTLNPGDYKAYKRSSTGTYSTITLPGQTVAQGRSSSKVGGRPVVTIKTNQMTDMRRNEYDNQLSRSAAQPYNPKDLNLIEVDMTALQMAVDRTVKGLSSTTRNRYDDETDVTKQSTYRANTTITAALDDKSQIENFSASDWNGAIYVESVGADYQMDANGQYALDSSGKRIPGHRQSGVRLINGKGTVPSHGTDKGLTLATNDALYVLGHFNSDGVIRDSGVPTASQLADISTTDASGSGNNSSLFRDSANEVPAALVADAITILSTPTFDSSGNQTAGWNDSYSKLRFNTSNYSTAWRTGTPDGSNRVDGDNSISGANADPVGSRSSVTTSTTSGGTAVKFSGAETEIAAAFLIGLTPSKKHPTNSAYDLQQSGGLHNLPRFLENYGSSRVAIRGSMVVMFESRVAVESFNLRVYGPPRRVWGFNNLFRNDEFPPLVPATRVVGTIGASRTQVLSRDQYITQRAALWPTYTFPTLP